MSSNVPFKRAVPNETRHEKYVRLRDHYYEDINLSRKRYYDMKRAQYIKSRPTRMQRLLLKTGEVGIQKGQLPIPKQFFKYGLPTYLGNVRKTRSIMEYILSQLSNIAPQIKTMVDMFGGGGALTNYAYRQKLFNQIILNDITDYPKLFLQGLTEDIPYLEKIAARWITDEYRSTHSHDYAAKFFWSTLQLGKRYAIYEEATPIIKDWFMYCAELAPSQIVPPYPLNLDNYAFCTRFYLRYLYYRICRKEYFSKPDRANSPFADMRADDVENMFKLFKHKTAMVPMFCTWLNLRYAVTPNNELIDTTIGNTTQILVTTFDYANFPINDIPANSVMICDIPKRLSKCVVKRLRFDMRKFILWWQSLATQRPDVLIWVISAIEDNLSQHLINVGIPENQISIKHFEQFPEITSPKRIVPLDVIRII